MLKEIDALHKTEKIQFSEKKFFEMECQVLDFGVDPSTGKPTIALHFTYPFTDEPISGLVSNKEYIETYMHEELKGDHSDFGPIISFNNTLGTTTKLKIF